MTSDRTATDRPRPEDPDFFTRYAAPAGLLDWAFGPAGGTPPPRRTRPDRNPHGTTGSDQSRPPVDRR